MTIKIRGTLQLHQSLLVQKTANFCGALSDFRIRDGRSGGDNIGNIHLHSGTFLLIGSGLRELCDFVVVNELVCVESVNVDFAMRHV
jgi:hypothetical protein